MSNEPISPSQLRDLRTGGRWRLLPLEVAHHGLPLAVALGQRDRELHPDRADRAGGDRVPDFVEYWAADLSTMIHELAGNGNLPAQRDAPLVSGTGPEGFK